jgi:hypothetical protein
MSVGRSGPPAIALGGLVVLVLAAFGAASAWAEPSTYCVKATKVSKIISGKTKHVFTGGFNDKGCTSVNGTHEGKFEKLASFTAPEEAQLKALLKYLTVQASGVGGQPTVKLTGANLQVASGAKEAETNGTGNVVVGADETPRTQTGSNNLVLGGPEQEFTSYGGFLAGFINSTRFALASVLGGSKNQAFGYAATVSGGGLNTASGLYSSVSGGEGNVASNFAASVSGGGLNTASGERSSISGGSRNAASGEQSSVSGGEENKASGLDASVSNGRGNQANGSYAAVSGGGFNTASFTEASVSGGEHNTASAEDSWVGGGYKNEVVDSGIGAEGKFTSIFGGRENKTAKDYEAIP